MNPTENWGPASRARPVGKAVATAVPDANMREAAELGLLPEEVVDPITEDTEKNEEGLDVEQVKQAEEVVEVNESTVHKRSADETDGRSGKKARTTATEEEEMMNEL